MWEKTTLPDATWITLNDTENPVIPRGGLTDSDYYIRELGNILYEPTDTGREFKFWYTGYNVGEGTDEKIHYAYSSDGRTWTKSTNSPVIAQRAEDPYVVKLGDTYYMFVEDRPSGEENLRRFSTTDPDGTWTNDGLITGIANCQSPVVWIEGATWYMLYERYPTAPIDIRLATSSDGLAWTDEATNPVFSRTDSRWVLGTLACDDIVKIDDTYYMIYHGYDSQWREGIASSTDLLTWTDTINCPIRAYDSSRHDMVTAMIFHDGTEYVFLYYENDTDGVYRGYPAKGG